MKLWTLLALRENAFLKAPQTYRASNKGQCKQMKLKEVNGSEYYIGRSLPVIGNIISVKA